MGNLNHCVVSTILFFLLLGALISAPLMTRGGASTLRVGNEVSVELTNGEPKAMTRTEAPGLNAAFLSSSVNSIVTATPSPTPSFPIINNAKADVPGAGQMTISGSGFGTTPKPTVTLG